MLTPLHESLLALEQQWRSADQQFERSPELAIALEQTRLFADHQVTLTRELALLPSLRVALVREGVWTARQAFTSCLRYPPSLCGHWLELLDLLPDDLVDELDAHTRGPLWSGFVPHEHPGLWVSKKAGGESLIVRLCARLAERGELDRARALLVGLRHVGARIDALARLWPQLDEAERAREFDETLARCRGLDPIRRLYALCELSRLAEPEQALALVDEAVAGLPPGHEWVHFPGGLMLMMLGEPVIDALDREGLREHLVAWVEREGEALGNNLLDGYAERLAELSGRPYASEEDRPPLAEPMLERARAGDLSALLQHDAQVPDAMLGDALALVEREVRSDPGKPWPMLVLLRLAARAHSEAAFALLDERITDVAWHSYSYPEPVWAHAEFASLSAATRRRVLEASLAALRASASLFGLEREIQRIDARVGVEPNELASRWLAGARLHADPRAASQRWSVAEALWGAAGVESLRRVLVDAQSRAARASRAG